MSHEEVWHLVSIQDKTRQDKTRRPSVIDMFLLILSPFHLPPPDGRVSRYLSWYNESFGEPV
jgi:hypothetical protein